jgi:hypothetical protein
VKLLPLILGSNSTRFDSLPAQDPAIWDPKRL